MSGERSSGKGHSESAGHVVDQPWARETTSPQRVSDDRLAPLTDGVVAVIMTIMVLEMRPPAAPTLRALATLWPTFSSYLLSFFYVSVYWNRHRTFFRLLARVNGGTFWANMNFLFWLSLIPFATAWVGRTGLLVIPTAVYGLSLFMVAVSWNLFQVLCERQLRASAIQFEGALNLKGHLGPLLYLAGVALSFVTTIGAYAIYAAVAGLWLLPERRMEARR